MLIFELYHDIWYSSLSITQKDSTCDDNEIVKENYNFEE